MQPGAAEALCAMVGSTIWPRLAAACAATRRSRSLSPARGDLLVPSGERALAAWKAEEGCGSALVPCSGALVPCDGTLVPCPKGADSTVWEQPGAGRCMVVVVNGLLSNGRLPHAYYYKQPRHVEWWQCLGPCVEPCVGPCVGLCGRTPRPHWSTVGWGASPVCASPGSSSGSTDLGPEATCNRDGSAPQLHRRPMTGMHPTCTLPAPYLHPICTYLHPICTPGR